VFKHAFVPAILGVSLASWTFRRESEPLLKTLGLPFDQVTAVLLVTLLAIALAEWAYPSRAEWGYRLISGGGARGWSGFLRDLLYLLVIAQVSAALIGLTSWWLKSMLASYGLDGWPKLWPSEAPFAVRALLAFFAAELFSYWLHRAAHHVPLLWQFHSTHHTLSELNGLKALRTHPVDNLLFHLFRSLPLILCGAGTEEIQASVYFGAILGILSHANVDVSEGPLGWVVNFPRYHEVHHSSDIAESRSNFGCHTVLWDRLFRTFRKGADAPLQIGVLPLGRRTLWQELVWPFYRRI
jgi:sterol desaturase/sphingolipid hydroxylase (fatty acid hydroxylase superfamily)